MSKADAKAFLEKLGKDPELQKELSVEESMVILGKKRGLTFTVNELDEVIEEQFKSLGSGFLEGLGFSEVPGF